jgi:subtilisin family serine protease
MRLPEVGVAVSAGNEGNAGRHYKGTIEASQTYKEFNLKIGENENGFSMELWQDIPYRLSINIITTTGDVSSQIYPTLTDCRKLTFIFEPSIVWINNVIFESESGDQLILIRFENPQPGIWTFQVRNLDQSSSGFNVWLPSGDLISDETFFLEPDSNTTITSPGNAVDPLTVTAYDPESGGIAIFSSRGYTRRGVVKPELAAPGVNLVCPSFNNSYVTVSGTGAATAHTVGIIAMILEWAIVNGNYTTINGFDIKQLLIRGANRSENISYPNNIWGYGKVDVFGLFRMLIP